MICFAAPTLSSVAGVGSAATGSSSVTVFGAGLGAVDYSVRSRVGDTSCEATVWVSDSSMQCSMAAGRGQSLSVVASVVQREASVSTLFSYGRLSVTSVAPVVLPVTAATQITLLGANFGSADYSLGVTVGSTSCAGIWVADSSFACTVTRGSGAGLEVVMTKSTEVSTAASTFSYQGEWGVMDMMSWPLTITCNCQRLLCMRMCV